jgi:hypothetical protein
MSQFAIQPSQLIGNSREGFIASNGVFYRFNGIARKKYKIN